MNHHRGAAGVAGAAASACGAIHLAVAPAHVDHGAWLAPAFVAVGALLVAAGAWAAASGGRAARVVVAGLALSTVTAYVASRTVGLPGTMHHHDGWDAAGVLASACALAAAMAALGPAQLRRRHLAALTSIGLIFGAPGVVSALPGDANAPDHCVEPTRAVTLYAEELPPGVNGEIRLGYGLTPATASTPGPLLEMTEGECISVTLVNNVRAETLAALASDPRWPGDPDHHPLGVSLHVHGVKYTPVSDGTLHTGSFVPPGGARTYVWYAAPRTTVGGRVTSLGTAGYWWYHDHVAGTDHGTGGVAAGLLGGLVVRRPGDLPPDRSYTIAMGGPRPMINHASAPDTFVCDRDSNRPSSACIVARKGERVEILVIGVPGTVAKDDFHTFHLHGHNWADNRTGMLASAADETRLIDAKIIGPSETFGFQVVAGEEVGPGDWMLHCHVQQHSDAGMVSFFRVLDPGTRVGTASAVSGAAAHGHAGHDH